MILRLFRGETVTEKTDWYKLVEASQHLPRNRPYPEVCVASTVTPSGGRFAGKYDLGMLCVAAGENAGFNALDVNWGIANESRQSRDGRWTRAAATRRPHAHRRDPRTGPRTPIRTPGSRRLPQQQHPPHLRPDGVDPVDWYVEQGIAVIGTPDDAIARIERLQQKHGEFGAVLLDGTTGPIGSTPSAHTSCTPVT